MPLGIDPKVDYAFKKLFGSQENKPILIDFLQAVEVLQIMTDNDLEHQRYEARLKAQRDESSLKTVSFQEGKIEGERIGIQKGEQIGLLEAIEGLLEVRFREEGLQWMPEVRLLADVPSLRQLQQALRKNSSIEEFRQLLHSLSGKISN
jgi:hypothetical protein